MNMAFDFTRFDYAEVAPKAIDTGLHATDRVAWLRERMTGFTSSDAAALLGFDDGGGTARSALAVYAEKMGNPIKEYDAATLEIFEVGNELEAPVLNMYGRRVGHTVVQSGALLRHKDHPFIMQTVDGIDLDAREQVEVKTYAIFAAKKWHGDEIPRRVFCQVQHQLLFGQPGVQLVRLPLNERRLRWSLIEPNAEFQALMLEQLAEHWDRLQRGHLPEPDHLESTRDALNAIYPDADGSTVELPEEWDATSEEYERLTALEREAEKKKDQIKNDLRYLLGRASYGKTPGGRKWSLLAKNGPSHTCTACGNVDRSKPTRSATLTKKKEPKT